MITHKQRLAINPLMKKILENNIRAILLNKYLKG